MRGGLGPKEVPPRLVHLLAHELGVLSRRPERGAALAVAGERRTDELPQEPAHPLLLGSGHMPGNPGPDLVPSLGE